MQGAVKTLVFLSLFHAVCAHAGVFYICKDAAGRTLTSDRPIPECADRTIREYGSNGVLKREIVPPPTAEQKREKAAEAQRRKAELAAVEEQNRSDRALLARYRSEDDIAKARQRDSAPLIEQLDLQKSELAVAEKEWQVIRTAVDTQREKGDVPQIMQTKQARALENVRTRKNAVRDSDAALARINAKYDEVLQRYRDISQMASSK
jgi:hypothetical protein